MRRQLVTGLRLTACLVVLLGFVYPLAVWAVGRLAFADRTDGSLRSVDGVIVGSALIGQSFTDADGNPIATYFQPRPSAAGTGYDASSSGASNLGPGNPDLLEAVAARARAYRELNGLGADVAVPVDAVTASGSGLDPHISPANARLQAARVATARGLPLDTVMQAIARHTQGRQWGVLGEKSVNVLLLNLDLDAGG